MIQLTPQLRIFVALEPADFRCGIDGLARLCRKRLGEDPFSGAVFVFCNRRRTAIKILLYDGQGYWMCYKRLSQGRFRWWPCRPEQAAASLQAHELQVLFRGGDPEATKAAPEWRRISS